MHRLDPELRKYDAMLEDWCTFVLLLKPFCNAARMKVIIISVVPTASASTSCCFYCFLCCCYMLLLPKLQFRQHQCHSSRVASASSSILSWLCKGYARVFKPEPHVLILSGPSLPHPSHYAIDDVPLKHKHFPESLT